MRWRFGTTVALLAVLASPLIAADLTVTVSNAAGRPLAGAVVFLQSSAAEAAVKAMPQREIGQENKTFVPDQLVVTRGTAVNFPNRDTVRHHVYSFSPAKRFELKLYIGTPAAPVVFDTAGVAVLGCNIHDHMVAWVIVVDTPWYAVSDSDGRAVLRDVPPGDYALRTWHRALPVGAAAQDVALALPDGRTSHAVRLEGVK